jgi:transposase-like protein
MNQEQKQRVLAQLDPFWKVDIDKRIADVYKDYTDLSSIAVGYYTVSELSQYSKKVISQLGQVLETPFSNILPFQYQFQNDFGNGNLGDDLTNMNALIEANNFTDAVNVLTRLVYYQVANGFWDKVLEKDDKKRFAQIVEMESKLNLASEILNKNIETNKTLLESLKAEKENLETLVSTKKKELGEIEGLLPTARNNSEELNRLLNTSTATNESINGLLTQQNTNLDTITKKIEEEKTVYTAFQKDIKELKELFNTEIENGGKKNIEFDKMLASVLEQSKTFDKQILVLNELIGKEGAVRLFNTFNDRKKDLDAPVKRWAWIVIGTGVAALLLIIGIFTNFFGLITTMPMPQSIDWQFLVINSLKSTPIMIVLFFTIKQYVRERTFQEEYAFRSAIALTVQAYGDISGSKKEDLILQAVSTIYSLPSMMKDKPTSFFGYRSKTLTDTMKEINETLKTIKK